MQSESPPTAIVSGGSRGMGLAVAQQFAELGGRVAVLSRSAGALGKARESLQILGSPDVLALTADVTDERSVADAFAAVGEAWSEVNVLVNAVGPSGVGRFDDIGDEV